MSKINVPEDFILPLASLQENRIAISIVENLKQNFSIAHDQNKLQEFMREYMVGIISINQKAEILPDVKFESGFEGDGFKAE